MNNQERQALIEFIKSELACWTSEGQYHQVLRVALAALTAEPKEISKDIIREIFMRNGFTIKDGQSDLKDYVYASAYELLRLNAIDNTARQYEALAGWKMVPIEPTNEMMWAAKSSLSETVGWDSFKEAYFAFLATAPKPEGKC
ncbi:MAG: hypothetical protein E6Z79_00725 [Haemophilus parainfluenzae]|nr:hypothetical protein [Haemophilus parainfluenzae]